MKKLISLLFFVSITSSLLGQGKPENNLVLNVDLTHVKNLLLKVVIKKTDLGNYNSLSDTCKIKGADKVFNYSTKILEPQLLKITFYWEGSESTSTSSWVIPSDYQISIDNNLKPNFINDNRSNFNIAIDSLEKQITDRKNHLNILLKNVNYENQKVSEVENRIYYLRDSIDLDIDENIYMSAILDHLKSPVGLYTLCKYAEKPYSNQRLKSQPKQIEAILNKFDKNITDLPSAKILLSKLALGEQMAIGNELEDISLSDTSGRIVKISDFKGKYLLVDFWASWCMPCREENPMLISAFKKYKEKGFFILNITIDNISAKKNWLNAIHQDQINLWPQLSDFNKVAQKTYGIRFIPTNYLIDPMGIIIARDLREDKLMQKLEELMPK